MCNETTNHVPEPSGAMWHHLACCRSPPFIQRRPIKEKSCNKCPGPPYPRKLKSRQSSLHISPLQCIISVVQGTHPAYEASAWSIKCVCKLMMCVQTMWSWVLQIPMGHKTPNALKAQLIWWKKKIGLCVTCSAKGTFTWKVNKGYS